MKTSRLIVFLATLALAKQVGFSQNKSIEKDGSVFSLCAEQLNAIYDLRLQGKRLTIDLPAWESNATTIPLSESSAEHIEHLRKSGFPEEHLKRRIDDETKKLGIEVLVDNLSKAAGGTGGGKSSSGERIIMRRRGKALVLYYLQRPGYRFFRVAEEKHPQRVLSMEQRPDGQFRLVLMGDESNVVLSQSRKGKLHLLGTIEDEPVAIAAGSFPELLGLEKAKPLLELFRKAGVSWPATPRDFLVQQAVASRLKAMATIDQAAFQVLLTELGGKDFEKRESANEKLGQNYSLFKDLIVAELGNKELSLEARTRLSNLAKWNQKENEIDQVIREFNLLNDVEYLIDVLDRTAGAGKKFVGERLEKITKQSFETDAEAWKKWLKSLEGRK